MSGEFSAAQIGSLLADDDDEELLGGTAAKKEREIIESNRVKLANYIHDVTTLFPLLRQEGIFNRDDVEIIGAHVTTTAKVDKCLDVLLRKGPRAIGVFHEALSSHYLHLFNYLAQLFTQAGLQLPPSRQMKDEVDVVEKEKNPLDIRHSRSNSTYRNGSRSVTIRKRLEVMSRQCEMMEKEKDGLQRALGDREEEISSLLSTKEHVQTSLNHVQGKYQELLSQLAHWRAVLESDDAVKQWAVERESIQREYDQMEQEYNLQCSELNAARERISLLLQQLDRCENIVSITQESSQKEKDVLKHKIAVQEGEIQRLLAKLDYVITTPPSSDGKGSAESAVVRCEKMQRELDRANGQITTLEERLKVLQKERMGAYDERDEMTTKLYKEKLARKAVEKENKQLKMQFDSLSNHSETLYSPQTPQKMFGPAGPTFPPFTSRHLSLTSSEDGMGRGGAVKVESMEVFMPAPREDADLGMKLEMGIVVKELKEGSQPHLHGVRIGDEICQVNKFTLSGERPLEFFNRLLYSATQPVTLTLRRQVPATDTAARNQCNTLPAQLPIASPLTSRPISPSFLSTNSLPPLHAPSSSIFPLSPQLAAATLSRKVPAFQSPPIPPAADSPVNVTTLEASLDGKTLSQHTGRVSMSGTSNSSSSDEDGERGGVQRKGAIRAPVIIPQQRHPHNRFSSGSEQIGIVGSPTERSPSVWKDNRLTRISTIDSGFEFPFDEHSTQECNEEEESENLRILDSEQWDVVEPVDTQREGKGERGEEEGGEEEVVGRGFVRIRDRPKCVGKDQRWSRQKGVYNKKHISKSLDDLNEAQAKPLPLRRSSRNGERSVSITKEEYSSLITLIGGRGYGMFIETDSRKLTVETGDKILEVGDKCIQGLTRAEVIELLEAHFSRKETAPLTVLYDAKALSQLPPLAKDDFHVRCTQFYRPPHSLLSKSNELAFEKGDVLHITNTLPPGHLGYWQAEKVGSKGEILAVGLVPIVLTPDLGDDCSSGSVSLPLRIKNIGSPKLGMKGSKASSMTDDQKSTAPSTAKAFNIYRPVRRVLEVQDPRPVVLLGVLQKDFRKYLINHSDGTPENDVKFCFPMREEESKLEKCTEDDIVERIQENGKIMISTTTHIKELAREGYHCVLCIDAEGLPMPGLQSLMPIVLMLHATTVRAVNKIRQRLYQEGDISAQEEIDSVESLKRYRQYFTGQIDLQGSMCDVVKEIRTTVIRQQKSIMWEYDS